MFVEDGGKTEHQSETEINERTHNARAFINNAVRFDDRYLRKDTLQRYTFCQMS